MPARIPTHYINNIEGLKALYAKSVSVPTTAGGTTLDALFSAVAGTTALGNAVRATISVAAACHLTFDGLVLPTSSVGHPIAAGTTYVLEGNQQINSALLISDSGSVTTFITLEG